MEKQGNFFDLSRFTHSNVYKFCFFVCIGSNGEACRMDVFVYSRRHYTGMERMKLSKHILFVSLLTVLIFFIPFFWLKPGEMDLGGDSSRLYFYDPIAYLVSQSLYSVSHSGLGGENLSYFGIPFFLLLAGIKWLVTSPTILIGIFHGLNLSGGFVSCYLVVKELLKSEETSKQNRLIIESSGILAGLYYTFSPNPIGGWGYPLLPMNLIFLNPLLFFLLLRFFLTESMRYIFISLLITFLFSPNFSFIGAPTFFSFFPLAVLFLLIYIKVIKKNPIPLVKILFALILFVLIQAFHLLPQVASILTPGSVANETVFGNFGKFEWGLKYFLGTAPIIKVSNSILGLPQFGPHEIYYPLYAVFPLLMVMGLWRNKSRLYLLSGIFFLLTLFLITANITSIGFKLYVLAFRLPGFSMFRVFYGQWAWTHLFFSTVFIGLAIATVLPKLKMIQRYLLVGFIVVLFLVTSWSLISGKLTDTTHWQSKGIKSHAKMDPLYEEVLSYIRSLPADGKIVSFPLSGPGYQVLKGINAAAYEGPSTITYLAARNEFNGFQEFGVFGPSLLTAARERNYTMFRDILAMLNIKYIFYNEDPFIYTENYPGLPYEHVRDFFPDTQEGYKDFIKELGVKEIKSFGWKYHIYEIENSSYVPHIYIANKNVYWNDLIAINPHGPLSFYPEDKMVALYDDMNIYKKHQVMFDDVLIKARNTSTIFDFFKKKKEDKFVSPTISRKLSSPIYPLVILREKRDLMRYTSVDDAYIDRSIYFAEKRINELYELKNVPLLRNVASITELAKQWREPTIWEFTRFSEYNSWEVTLVRYQKAIETLVSKIDTANRSAYSGITSKVELKNYLKEHKVKLRTAIRQDSSLSADDRKYLSSLIERMFVDINSSLNLVLPDFSNIPYTVENPLPNGTYEVYINKDDIKNLNIELSLDGKKLTKTTSHVGEWLRFEDLTVEKPSLPIILSIKELPNLVSETHWKTAEHVSLDIFEAVNGQKSQQDIIKEDPATLSIRYNFLTDTSGFLRDIFVWEGDTIYAISFDYLTNDQNFSLVLHERGGTKTNRYNNDAYEETLRSKEWRKFSVAVLSAKNAESAFLQITKALDDVVDQDSIQTKKIEIKNLSVQKIYNPKVVLKTVSKSNTPSNPSIMFTQINPTKYVVNVRNATNPYTLVLSQEFNQKWKLFFPSREHDAKTVKGVFSRLIGTLLGTITKMIIPALAEEDSAIVASYANGAVQEGKHRTDFWNRDTFETWGQDPIAEATHLPVNGYANSWYIEPKDVSNQADYTLIIEMTPQKLFYGSLLISMGGLLLTVFLLCKSFMVIRK